MRSGASPFQAKGACFYASADPRPAANRHPDSLLRLFSVDWHDWYPCQLDLDLSAWHYTVNRLAPDRLFRNPLPVNVERAARIDGCSRLQALWHVIIPMALPGISAGFIIAFLFAWNELLFAIILTGGSSAQTLSPSLQAISQNVVLLTAASTLSVIPPFLLALFFQKFITRLNVVDPTTTP